MVIDLGKRLVDLVFEFDNVVKYVFNYNRTLFKINCRKSISNVMSSNRYIKMCRGIILRNSDKKIIEYPFDKFYNDFEEPRSIDPLFLTQDTQVTEKLDGVLIIPYKHEGKLKFSTRGSFSNRFTEMAEQVATFDDLPTEKYTFMFELISPDFLNFLVTKYEKTELRLIGLRSKEDWSLLMPNEMKKVAENLDLKTCEIYDDLTMSDIIIKKHEIGCDREGWVVYSKVNGRVNMMKVKRPEYFKMFKVKKSCGTEHGLKKIVVDNMLKDNAIIKGVPDVFHETAYEISDYVRSVYYNVERKLEKMYLDYLCDRKSRKEYFVRLDALAIDKTYKRLLKLYYLCDERKLFVEILKMIGDGKL
ncbi:MAG: RNA ligase [Promethearchaeota archaeon]|nr:MAG: RNA ligase [Helarchaeota virus Nidhogg Meg22_1012]URC17481.1 MAG: RNA ligase [Helarchaeota virus Nidhogg Meg22_1214]